MRRRYLSQRPDIFTLNPGNPYAQKIAFLGAGGLNCPGSLNYADSSFNRNNGTLTGTPASMWNRAVGRPCVTLNGSSNAVTCPNFNIAGKSLLTFCLWFNVTNSDINNTAILAELSANYNINYGSFVLYSGNTSSTFAAGYKIASGQTTAYSFPATSVGWHHFAVLINAGNTSTSQLSAVYVDGVSQSLTVITLSTGTASTFGSYPLYLGARSSSSLYASGGFCDVIAFPSLLTQSFIQRLSDPSNFLLDTGGGNPLLLPPRRMSFPSVGGATGYSGTLAATARRSTAAIAGTYTAPALTGAFAIGERRGTAAITGTYTAPALTGAFAAGQRRGTAAMTGNYSVPGVYLGTLSAVARRGTAALSGTYTAPTLTGSFAAVARRGSAAMTAGYWAPGSASGAPVYYYKYIVTRRRN
jgi:hypothetical protein